MLSGRANKPLTSVQTMRVSQKCPQAPAGQAILPAVSVRGHL